MRVGVLCEGLVSLGQLGEVCMGDLVAQVNDGWVTPLCVRAGRKKRKALSIGDVHCPVCVGD